MMTGTESATQRAPRWVHVDENDDAALAEVVADELCVRVSFHVRGGHLPPGVRPALVEQVFALPDVGDQDTLQAAVPLGDTELLQALRGRCSSMRTRAAGSTCLVDGVLAHEPKPAETRTAKSASLSS